MNEKRIPTKVKVEKKAPLNFDMPTEKAELAVVEQEETEEEEAPVEDGEEKYAKIRKEAKELREKTAKLFWDFAVVLSDIQEHNLYIEWGYDSWGQYIDQELEIGQRAVQKYKRVYDWFKKMPTNIQEWVQLLGWTKAQYLVGVVTPENAGEWRNKIAGLTVSQIEEMVDNFKKGVTGDDSEGGGGDSSSGNDSGERPIAFKVNLMPEQDVLVKEALEKAQELSESDKTNHNLTLICMDFLQNNANIRDMKDILERDEKAMNIKVIAYREVNGEHVIAYGDHHLDTILGPETEE